MLEIGLITSCIKQANRSVQLFVQCCLMNLEPDVAANVETDEKSLQWKWMKNYRVWEANRKVFLYPESWIEPELRDDKSPFFETLESELLQSDLSKETAKQAFGHYLEKLEQVAQLEVMASFPQWVTTDKVIFHVFVRTATTPHVYFYRQQIADSVTATYWTAWEELDVGIEGDHLMFTVWNGRLYLFWLVFAEKSDPLTMELITDSIIGDEPIKYWEIKLAWSERKYNQW